MQLNVLAHGDVSQIASVLARDSADGAELAGRNDAVGNANAHHEPFRRQPFTALAARGADAVALGVDAPPFEVGRRPLGHHTGPSLARERRTSSKASQGFFSRFRRSMRWALVSFCGISLIYFLCLNFGVKTDCKNGMPASAFAVRGHLGSRTRFLDLDRGYLYHACSVHPAATTDRNVHGMNIDRNGPICKFGSIVDSGTEYADQISGSAASSSARMRCSASWAALAITGERSMEMGCWGSMAMA